jgi:hypothetical protein
MQQISNDCLMEISTFMSDIEFIRFSRCGQFLSKGIDKYKFKNEYYYYRAPDHRHHQLTNIYTIGTDEKIGKQVTSVNIHYYNKSIIPEWVTSVHIRGERRFHIFNAKLEQVNIPIWVTKLQSSYPCSLHEGLTDLYLMSGNTILNIPESVVNLTIINGIINKLPPLVITFRYDIAKFTGHCPLTIPATLRSLTLSGPHMFNEWNLQGIEELTISRGTISGNLVLPDSLRRFEIKDCNVPGSIIFNPGLENLIWKITKNIDRLPSGLRRLVCINKVFRRLKYKIKHHQNKIDVELAWVIG